MGLDNIKAGADTVMTDELIRLFAYAGCDPTICHACEKKIKVGDIFKLLPHATPPFMDDLIDEMCCVDCGEKQLVNRDRRLQRAREKRAAGGFSRPSAIPHAVLRNIGGNV